LCNIFEICIPAPVPDAAGHAVHEEEPPRNRPVLVVEDLTVRFAGVLALDHVSLELAGGEVLGVIGPNGAGKTTLFNVICGFVAPDTGTLSWRGQLMARMRPHRLAGLGIARTLQGVGLFERLTVLENVMAGAEHFRRAKALSGLLGLPRSDRDERELRERALTALTRLGCEDVAARLPATLPYAVRKRVALARSLVAEPELLLLDEPAGGLDAGELSEMAKLIDSLRSSIAVMVVEHHMDFVTSVCDRVVVLDFGRVIAEGPPSAIGRDPLVLEAYLGRAADTDMVAAGGAGDGAGTGTGAGAGAGAGDA
jgi:branched-chain amino acid transport system ATP-binding protein